MPKDTRLLASRARRFDAAYPHFPVMRAAGREVALAILDGAVPMASRWPGRRLGVEIETSAVTTDGQPLAETVRDALVAMHVDEGWQKELGAAQIEIATAPVELQRPGGLTALREEMLTASQALESALRTMAARPIRSGTNPFVPTDEGGCTSSAERYHLVPAFHRRHRRRHAPRFLDRGGRIPADRPTVVGAMSSVQFNLDCADAVEAIRLINRALVTVGFTVALGANARYLDGRDTGWADVRGRLWELSHDIRTEAEARRGASGRAGLPDGYYADLADFFADMLDQPSVINDPDRAFDLGTGLLWRDARLKFLRRGTADPQIVLEFRPLSLQPSPEEDFAMIAFAAGHVLGSATGGETLLPFPLVRANRLAAMRHGLDSELWSMSNGRPRRQPARRILDIEMDKAAHGLATLGATADELRTLTERWRRRLLAGTPSGQLAERVRKSGPPHADLRTTLLTLL